MTNRSNSYDPADSHHGKRYTTGIMVFCFVVGTRVNTSYSLTASGNVSKLRETIFDKNENLFKSLKVDANQLSLWQVDIPWGEIEKLEKLQDRSSNEDSVISNLGGKLLFPHANIEDIFNSSSNIRIIVQPPATGKRKAEYSDSGETNITKKEKLIDLSSPESIVRFFTEDDENKKWIKADFAKPHKLCDNKFNFKREGRDDALYQLYDYIYNRHCGISNAKSFGDKALHPLLALQSAPGGGKSFFFDELASLKDEDINLISHYLEKKYPQNETVKEVINIIRNSIGICITYNGGSSYDGNVDRDIRRGLIMRILWNYFFDENKLTWSDFCDKFGKHFDSSSTYMAIGSIIRHSGKSVLLCIDETMRVLPNDHSDLENIKTLLNELYKPYRDFSKSANKFYFVISTLDTLNVWKTQTDSQRPICWIPLRRLVLSESANLFCKLVRNLDERRLFVIKKCISDCNGHPRTLEKFYQVINVENGDDTTLNTDNYSSLMERLARNLKQLLGRISLPIVKIALFGKEKSLTDEIETKAGKSNLRDLISSGIYINSLTDEGEIFSVIPTLSPVSLQYFCIYNKDSESEAIAKILRRLLTTESSFDEEVMDGKPFEKFHTNWELLYRALQENGKNVSLRNIYDLPDENWKKIEIQLQRKEIAYCHDKIEFPPNGNIYDTNHNTFENLVDYIFVPKKSNNSGFDMVIFEKKSDGSGYIAINLECRFSYPGKKTTLESKEISEKYEHMKSKYLMHVKYLSGTRNNVCWEYGKFYDKSAVGKLKMSENDIYLVFVIWRNIGNLGNNILDNENIIIVNRDNLKKIYTPSLVTRPQFYGDELQKIKDIRYENTD